MGRGAGDDLEAAGVLELAECPNDVAVERFDENLAGLGENFLVKLGQSGELRLVAVALDLLPGKTNQAFEMAEIALLQELVAQHRAEGRREGKREPEIDALVHQPPHHPEQGKVGFRDRFEEPVFLEEILVFRVPNERQMGVEDECEMSRGHAQARLICRRVPLGRAAEGLSCMGSQLPRFAERSVYKVRQKSWNRSSPFLITSMLVA